jgi:hypothetical protein
MGVPGIHIFKTEEGRKREEEEEERKWGTG